MDVMGIDKPNTERFAQFLRACVVDSENNGYHKLPLTPEEALWLRLQKDPGVEVIKGMRPLQPLQDFDFFPNTGGRDDYVGGHARGGRPSDNRD
jgi:hypothetical protein